MQGGHMAKDTDQSHSHSETQVQGYVIVFASEDRPIQKCDEDYSWSTYAGHAPNDFSSDLKVTEKFFKGRLKSLEFWSSHALL